MIETLSFNEKDGKLVKGIFIHMDSIKPMLDMLNEYVPDKSKWDKTLKEFVYKARTLKIT